MKYVITIQTNYMDRFSSSINFVRSSKTFYFDILFTAASIVVLAFSIYTGAYFKYNLFRKILLSICPLIFTVIQPIILYIKSKLNTKSDNEVTLTFDINEIIIQSSDESVTLKYINIYNFIKFKNMIVIMYDSIHGQIIPDRFLNFDKNEFYKTISERINYARKNHNEVK